MISLRIMKSHDQPINRSVLNWRTDHANGDFVLGLDDSLAHFRNSFRVNWVGVGLLGWSCSHFRSLCPIGLEVFREPNPGVSYDTRMRLGSNTILRERGGTSYEDDKGSASIPERISTRYSSGIHLLGDA